MLVSCTYFPYILEFRRAAGTSRGVLKKKLSYFLRALDEDGNEHYGECGLLKGLSIDDRPEYEQKLKEVCDAVANQTTDDLELLRWPSIRCGLEILLKESANQEKGLIFSNDFFHSGEGIPINGLVWMGSYKFMKEQIVAKTAASIGCIKMKVGAIDWEAEKELLELMRSKGGDELIIRVDANGAWDGSEDTKKKLDFLRKIKVHSIEQPTKVGKLDELNVLLEHNAIDIALDEELFHHQTHGERVKLLDGHAVPFVVLKPSLVGGFVACDEWIELCNERGIGYWITSALESNVALNAIAQYSYPHSKGFHQGLGTGSLYRNNIDSPLTIHRDQIFYDRQKSWSIPAR